MKGLIKNYNEDDAMSKILMLYFAFQHGVIGTLFIFIDLDKGNSEILKALSTLMPLDAWGVVLLFSSISFVCSVLLENKAEFYFMIIAGTTGMMSFGILAMANIELGTGQTNTINYIIIASIDFIIATIGGVAVWLRKRM